MAATLDSSRVAILETIGNILADGVTPVAVRAVSAAIRSAFSADASTVDMDHVPQKDGSFADEAPFTVGDILSPAESNVKLSLSDDATDRYLTFGVSLAPAAQNGLRSAAGRAVDLCSHASAGCKAVCLFGTGHARVARNVRRARIGKSRLWITRPEFFKARLVLEIARAALKAESLGKTLLVRLNVFSDIAWERKFPELFTMFPDVQFYDYTKIASRVGRTPSNYHLTFSRSESNHDIAIGMLRRGVSVAVVFEDHAFPKTWHGFPVIDGTLTDLRILDPTGVVVALAEKDTELHGPQYKGKRNTAIDTRGFVLPTITSNAHGQPVTLA